MDMALTLINGIPTLSMNLGDITTDSGLRTAVIYSLFTDRRADEDDELPDNSGNRRGSWQDQYLDIPGDIEGSRLWLLRRSKKTPSVLARGKEYAEEALQWLIDDGVATQILVTTSWKNDDWLVLKVRIELPSGTPYEDVFNYPLEAA